MDELQQLVRLIEKKGRLTSNQLINFADEENLETKLYYFLKNNTEYVEEEAIEYLYNTKDKRDAFKMLKSRVRKKLYNQLHFLKDNFFLELASAEIKCNRLINEANFLYHSQANELAEKRILTAIHLAKQMFLTTEVVQALELYQTLLVYGFYNKQKYEACKIELKHYNKILASEKEATNLFNDVYIHVNADIDTRHSIANQSSVILPRMEYLWKKSGSPKIFKQYHKVKLTLLELNGKFKEQISFIKEISLLYEKGTINPFYFSLPFNKYILAYACLRAQEYEEGIQASHEALSLTKEHTHNWFSALENLFLLNLHSKKYNESKIILKDALAHPLFCTLDEVLKERWLLCADFCEIMFNQKFNHLDLNITIINKDKKGYNAWLIILDFLKFLKYGKLELLYREGERIRKYVSKHLDAKADPRYKLFLKLLVLVVKEEFDLIKIKQKSRYLFTKLSETKPAGDAYAEVEIVPFEHLWDFVLETLKEQKVKAA